MTDFKHVSVMPTECLEYLGVKAGGVYFDGTLGGGGHTGLMLEKSAPSGRVVATDLDEYAINRASEKLKNFGDRFVAVRDNFKNILSIKERLSLPDFDGILLDLGVSSFQLDDRSRGFSYMANDCALDMRMDNRSDLTAKVVVNTYDQESLKKILIEYGEERFAGNIAKNIVGARLIKPIETCGQLVEIIEKSIPAKFKGEGHVAKRTFQALRIEVNGELEGLKNCVYDMVKCLKKGGRIAILTFHSLEDRIVKQAFEYLEKDCVCPKDFPVCVCDKKREVKIITKHPIIATDEEITINKRAKSAKLRVAQKL